MAGPLADAGAFASRQRTIPAALRWGPKRGKAMGKFFLIIIAISVAVLLAMSAYVISL
jgi:hypothetical protein